MNISACRGGPCVRPKSGYLKNKKQGCPSGLRQI